jgi:hypothetical protein
MWRACSMLCLVLSMACGEVVHDTGTACVMPQTWIECEDGATGGPIDGYDCSGEYVDGHAHEVQVWLGYGTGDSWDIGCEATVTGSQELSITASFRWKPDQERDGEPDVIAGCETPALSSGTWTVRYGEGEGQLDVGAGPRPRFCVYSGRDR